MSETTKKKENPVIFIELCDQRDSGFVRDGTLGTKHEERLTAPSVLFLPNSSFRIGKDADGRDMLEPIQYIKNTAEISVAKQKAAGIMPSPRSQADKIMIRNGRMVIERTPALAGLFDFINDNVEFNESNPDLIEGRRPIYKIIDVNKAQEEQTELEEMQNEAMAYVFSLREKRGTEVVYQEQKISQICELFTVYADTFSGKINALLGIAKIYAKDFLQKVNKFEQTSSVLVNHALQLNVISFTGNTAVYLGKDKVIKVLGTGKLKHEDKIDALAGYLRSKDGFEAYQELEAEVNFAKEKLNNE